MFPRPGGVDIANQYRASYEIHRKTERVWFPIFFFLIDAAIVNAYRIQYIFKKQQGASSSDLPSQLDFRKKLYKELFAFAAKPRPTPVTSTSHQRIQFDKRMACIWCQYHRQKGKRGQQAN